MPGTIDPGKIIQMAHFGKSATWTCQRIIPELVTSFLSLLRERHLPFVVVGGIALLQHVSGRDTDDIDLIISAPRLSELPELFIRERSEMFAYGHFWELRVDVLFAEHALFGKIAQDFALPMSYEIGVLPDGHDTMGFFSSSSLLFRAFIGSWTLMGLRFMRRTSCRS